MTTVYLMIIPSDFKKLWHVEEDWKKNKSQLVEMNILLRHVRIGPISQLTEIADPDVSLETEDDRAVDGGHQRRVDQRDQPLRDPW